MIQAKCERRWLGSLSERLSRIDEISPA